MDTSVRRREGPLYSPDLGHIHAGVESVDSETRLMDLRCQTTPPLPILVNIPV